MKLPYDNDLKSIEEGIFEIEEKTYRKIKALNITYAKLFKRSPAHVEVAIYDENAEIVSPSYAMKQGTGFHWAALEPERFKKEVVTDLETSKNSKVYKAWAEEQAHNLILSAKDIKNIRAMVSKMLSKSTALQYLQAGWAERSLLWLEPEYGIWCKGRIDFLSSSPVALIDLKKTQVATRWAFEGSIRRYDYYHQVAHYERGFCRVMNIDWRKQPAWIWIASEIDPPNECNVFKADVAEIDRAEEELLSWYEAYAYCLSTGEWPGYSDDIINLGYEFDPYSTANDDIPF